MFVWPTTFTSREFMVQWLKKYPTDVAGHLKLTDNEVLVGISEAASNPAADGYDLVGRAVGTVR